MSNAARPLEWITGPSSMRQWVEQKRRAAWREGRSLRVGLVPTMGNLHEGHLSLVRKSRRDCDVTVLTLFVNPIQFVAGEDLDRYPRTPEEDRAACEREGVDAIFAPSVETMYPPGSVTRVQVQKLEEPLCGHDRPGHFVGVATVVSKLFHLVPADVAYFGQKDFQQARLIRQLVDDLNFPIAIEVLPIVREADGLALSSRNAYLSPAERQQATALKAALDAAASALAEGERSADALRALLRRKLGEATLGEVDYAEVVDPDTLTPATDLTRPVLGAVAVRFGRARLIDNAILDPASG